MVDAATGGPLQGVTVAIRYDAPPPGQASLTSQNVMGKSTDSGDDGRFRLEAPEGVAFHLGAWRLGYLSLGEELGSRAGVPSYTLKAEERKDGIVLRMSAEAVLGGQLRDRETGKPVGGVWVMALRKTRQRGSLYWSPAKSALSDDDGKYSLKGLAPGEYKLMTRASVAPKLHRPAGKEATPLWAYPGLYYPGVDAFSQAAIVTLASGAIQDALDMKMEKVRFYTLRGELVGDAGTGEIEVGSVVEADFDMKTFSTVGRSEGVGAYEISGVAPGHHRFAAYSKGVEPAKRRQAILEVDVFKDMEKLDFLLQPGMPMSIEVSPAQRNVALSFAALDRYSFQGEQRSFRTGAEGKAVVEAVFPEGHRVLVGGIEPGWLVKRYVYNDAEFDPIRFSINPNATEHKMRIELAEAPNSLGGRVMRGEKPAGGAYVVAAREPLNARTLAYVAKRATANAEGQYSFSTLLAGKWRVAAVDGGLSYQEALELLLQDKGEKCEVAEAGAVSLQLKVD